MRVILPHGRSFHRGFPAFGGIGQSATKLVITVQPSATPATGVAFAQQPVIQLQDVSSSPVLQSGVTVTATRSAGSDTLGGTLTAVTDNSGLATFANLMFTGTSGSDAITFSASGLTPVTSSPINPAAGDAEPTFDAGTQTSIFSASRLNYANFPAALADGWTGVSRPGTFGDFVVYDGTMQDTSGCPTGANLTAVSPGYDGSGTCMGLRLTGIATEPQTGLPGDPGQEARTWHRNFTDPLLGKPGHAMYISYRFKIIPGAGYTMDEAANNVSPPRISSNIVKVKGVELYSSLGRAQFHFSYSTVNNDIPVTGAEGSGTMYAFLGTGSDADSPTAHCGQCRPPFLYQDRNSWHTATHKYVTQSAAGAHDGVGMMWLDGTLIVACALPYVNVVVPGGIGADNINEGGGPEKWCYLTDVDNAYTNDHVITMTLGGVSTSAFWPYSILYDHFSIWRD